MMNSFHRLRSTAFDKLVPLRLVSISDITKLCLKYMVPQGHRASMVTLCKLLRDDASYTMRDEDDVVSLLMLEVKRGESMTSPMVQADSLYLVKYTECS